MTPANPDAFEPKVDLYITKAKPFAQPILEHLRTLIHKAVPGVTETIKWSRPFFEYKGQIFANISAFNAHCSFGLWGEEISHVLREANVIKEEGMGTFGRITSVKDLPSDKQILAFLKQAKAFMDTGNYTSPIAARNKVVKAPKPKIEVPPEFTTALKANKQAQAVFQNFAPSCQREYTEWIADAKRPETRDKRITQAIEWLAEGKQRNWKYQNC
jgi:uncharacterized protein YdeI (YjbR/CyaY-like superfamily)